jgi:hypothetical protein
MIRLPRSPVRIRARTARKPVIVTTVLVLVAQVSVPQNPADNKVILVSVLDAQHSGVCAQGRAVCAALVPIKFYVGEIVALFLELSPAVGAPLH